MCLLRFGGPWLDGLLRQVSKYSAMSPLSYGLQVAASGPLHQSQVSFLIGPV
jgi:hypothetical protein